MIGFSILLAAALELSAHGPRTEKLLLVPYGRLPQEVRAGVLDAIGEACDLDSTSARKKTPFVRVFRADLDGDGIDDYVMDEWSGRCFRSPAHYVYLWRGVPGSHYEFEAHVEAFLFHGPDGFAWIQTRCNKLDSDDFEIESYRNGDVTRSKCYPADELKAELGRRGLTDAFPR